MQNTLLDLSSPINVVFKKKTEDLENLNELASLQSQVKAFRLQDQLGKQNFHEDVIEVVEPVAINI